MSQEYYIFRWVDGTTCQLVAVYYDKIEAEKFVEEHNGQPGGDVYTIDPAYSPEQTDPPARA
jgi:hypothetical protein